MKSFEATPRGGQQRGFVREFRSSVKGPAAPCVPGLSPLNPVMNPLMSSVREPSTMAPQEQAFTEPALAALATRLGSIKHLPELQVLVQDTVSVTLRGIKGLVETHVNRQLETEKLGIVETMVVRLLTEEVIRVTTQSAAELSRRELAVLSGTQKQMSEIVAEMEITWQNKHEQLMRRQQDLGMQTQSGAADAEKLRASVVELGLATGQVKGIKVEIAEAARILKELQASQEAAARRSDDLAAQAASDHKKIEDRHATRADHADLESRVAELACRIDGQGDAWLQAALRPLASQEGVGRQLEELEKRMCQKMDEVREGLLGHVAQVHQGVAAKHQSLIQAAATQDMLAEAGRKEVAARGSLVAELRQDLSELRRECAMREDVDARMDESSREQQRSLGDLQQSFFELRVQGTEAREAADVSDAQLQTLSAQVSELHQRTASLTDSQVRIAEKQVGVGEEMNHEKIKAQRIASQQQQNRTELTALINRSSELDSMRMELSSMQLDAKGQGHKLDKLQREVLQWDQAVTAQQGLRRDGAQMRTDISELQNAVTKLKEEQALGVSELRVLHDSVLR